MEDRTSILDTVIIGAGPAGMTAAIYAKRKGLTLAVIADSVGGQMGKTGDIENYPGYDVIRGAELARKMKEQMYRLGVEPVIDRVTGVEKSGSIYLVKSAGGRSFETRSIIVATGAHWREAGVPGEKEFVSRGISYCTTCDAPLFAETDVAVIGGANAAAEAVIELTGFASHVYMIVRSRLKCDEMTTARIRKMDKVTVLEGYVPVRIEGKDFVESLTIRSNDGAEKKLSVGGVFVEIGQDPNAAIVKDLVKINARGEVDIDDFCRTSAAGVFACGDVSSVPQKQVVVAAGEGAKAAMSAFSYISGLREKDVPSCTI